jgi:putative ABC transport system permease protein
MKILQHLKIAGRNLQTHRSRTGLTVLGIMIGITAIILVMSIGEGAQRLILNEVQGLGSTTVVVVPGREPKGPGDPSGILDTILNDSLKDRELEAISKESNVTGVSKVIPIVFSVETTSFDAETYRPTIIGTAPGLLDVFNMLPGEGRNFTEDEVKSNAPVALIGSRVKEELFGESTAVNEKIKIKNHSFHVIGVLGKKGQASLFNFDESIIVPVSTAQYYLLGIKYYNRLIIEAESETMVPHIVDDLKTTLRNLHGITDPDKDDFFIITQTQIMDTISNITNILTLLLVSIAAISLLVGGIGIMNIMLVSVTERTREIGLRKAVGATKSNILNQFLAEAIILTLIGGLAGILLGVGLDYIITLLIRHFARLNWAFIFPIYATVIGVSMAVIIGLIFGLYPARQAAEKSPIEALRYE